MRLPKLPAREPDDSFERPSDGMLVQVWVTKHAWRSKDKMLDGMTYYRALVAMGGHVHDHMPRRCTTPEVALSYVRGIFGVPSET